MTGQATAQDVLAYLRQREEAIVTLLDQLVTAESPTSSPQAQSRVHEVLTERLSQLGMRVRPVRSASYGDHQLAYPEHRKREASRQLVIGHLDTVWPVGTTADRPFAEKEGTLEGPGVYDMKAGLAQALFALVALRDLDLWPSVTPVLLINSDEELGSRDSRRWIQRLARGAARVFVLEPSYGPRGALKTARKGVGRFTVHIQGKAAHAGVAPEAGVSAILELSVQIQKLFALNDPAHGVTVNVGTIDGGLQPNVVAPEARAVVDVRVPTVADGERVEAAIRALEPSREGITITVEGSIGRPPMEPTDRNERLWHEAEAIGTDLGLDLENASVGGGSDGNFTSLYAATLDGLGPVGDGAHAAHEYVERSRLSERAALLAMLLAMPAEAPTP
jgi:glutamate carboxypeptidase